MVIQATQRRLLLPTPQTKNCHIGQLCVCSPHKADKEIDQLDNLDLRYDAKEEMLRVDNDAVPLLMGWALVRKIDLLTDQVKSTKGRAYIRGDMSIPDRDTTVPKAYTLSRYLLTPSS